MGKRPPILVDRRRSWLLALVVAASFAVHLGVIGYFGWQETDAPSTGPTFIEVALVGGGAAPKPAVPEVPEAPRTLDARKSKPPVEVAPRSTRSSCCAGGGGWRHDASGDTASAASGDSI